MKKVAILLGFCYAGTNSYLPGINIDLHRMYKWCVQAKFDNIHVIADIHNESVGDVSDLIAQQDIDKDVYVLIEELRRKQILEKYAGVERLIKRLTESISHADSIFFYFTGHGKERSLLLPNNESLAFHRLFSTLFSRSTAEHQLLVVLDCCHNDNIHMPFILSDGRYRLCKASKQKGSGNSRNYFLGEILCLVSSLSSQQSFTSNQGSVFTQVLHNCLRNKTKKCSSIVEKINEKSKKLGTEARVYSSSPCLYKIWPWMYRDTSTDISIDYATGRVKLKKR